MTHVKFESQHTGDERWIEAGAEAFAVHAFALVHCDQQGSDGRIGRAMAARVALPVPPDRAAKAVDTLVRLGFWEETTEGECRILDYESHALPSEEIRATRERWATDRRRRRKHSNGVHTECDPQKCRQAAMLSGQMSAPDTWADTAPDSSPESGPLYQTIHTRPDQTRPSGAGGRGWAGGRPPSAAAPSARATGAPHGAAEGSGGLTDSPHLFVETADAQDCELCGSPESDHLHNPSPGWTKTRSDRWTKAGWTITVFTGDEEDEPHGEITIDEEAKLNIWALRNFYRDHVEAIEKKHGCDPDSIEHCKVSQVEHDQDFNYFYFNVPRELVRGMARSAMTIVDDAIAHAAETERATAS